MSVRPSIVPSMRKRAVLACGQAFLQVSHAGVKLIKYLSESNLLDSQRLEMLPFSKN